MSRLRSGEEQVVLRAGVAQGQPAAPMNVTMNGKLTMTAAAPEGSPAPAPTTSRPGERMNPGQSAEIVWTRQGQEFEARIRIARPGEYRVKVAATAPEAGKNTALGEAETAFVVEASDLELTDPLADPEALKRLAGATVAAGGGYYPLDQLGQVLEKIRAAGQVTEITRYHRRQLVNDHPWLWFTLFLCLLATEWIVRRTAGLV